MHFLPQTRRCGVVDVAWKRLPIIYVFGNIFQSIHHSFLPVRLQVLAEISPLARFSLRFQRACTFDWRCFFFADNPEYKDRLVIKNELEKELQWAQGRPGSREHGKEAVCLRDSSCFRRVLTDSEEWYRGVYANQWPDSVFQLNQNPETSFETHSAGQVLATIIRNSHLLYWDKKDRWMTATEMLYTSLSGLPSVGADIPDKAS